MTNIVTIDPWNIIQDGYRPEHHQISESIFSIGNGKMGMRGNFEEDYSGESLSGNYIAGIYYPDKTRVGWWKNGYPEYFAKVLNAVNWIGLSITINGQLLDLNTCKILNYRAVLDMKTGVFERNFDVEFSNGNQIKVSTQRFYSIVDDEIGALTYSITAVNFSGEVAIKSSLNFDVRNKDSNYDDHFWSDHSSETEPHICTVKASTKKTNFEVVCRCYTALTIDNKAISSPIILENTERRTSQEYTLEIKSGSTLQITKIAATLSSFFHKKEDLDHRSTAVLDLAVTKGYGGLLKQQSTAWENKWKDHDIVIEGDISAQQAIRYNIFMLNQTYTGKDSKLNIGPKGFTGEKYGGSTYWDTEAYCLPFYLSTADKSVAKNLLIYRYQHLEKAIENAKKLGFEKGAALYPMVTMNGEECHNEWEITFEEIHRNGAIAHAIYTYINHTGDTEHMATYGIEVLIGICRFWAQRFNYSNAKNMYVMLGVTGPNEYENNVNNNWYTNYIAQWCLKYTAGIIDNVNNISIFKKAFENASFDMEEVNKWKDVVNNIYFPEDKKRGIFLQQDGFLDKELLPSSAIPNDQSPISHHWSWDRILRSCYIKQADVLQGLYSFEEDFSTSTLAQNFDFYEPMTVHESSLSPCIHSILACRLDRVEKAYELFLRTSRLDLDNINSDTEDGCHITSMGGTWMSIVIGFGGMKVKENMLSLSPMLPTAWTSLSFKLLFRDKNLTVSIFEGKCEIINHSSSPFSVLIYGKQHSLETGLNIFTTNKQLQHH